MVDQVPVVELQGMSLIENKAQLSDDEVQHHPGGASDRRGRMVHPLVAVPAEAQPRAGRCSSVCPEWR